MRFFGVGIGKENPSAPSVGIGDNGSDAHTAGVTSIDRHDDGNISSQSDMMKTVGLDDFYYLSRAYT